MSSWNADMGARKGDRRYQDQKGDGRRMGGGRQTEGREYHSRLESMRRKALSEGISLQTFWEMWNKMITHEIDLFPESSASVQQFNAENYLCRKFWPQEEFGNLYPAWKDSHPAIESMHEPSRIPPRGPLRGPLAPDSILTGPNAMPTAPVNREKEGKASSISTPIATDSPKLPVPTGPRGTNSPVPTGPKKKISLQDTDGDYRSDSSKPVTAKNTVATISPSASSTLNAYEVRPPSSSTRPIDGQSVDHSSSRRSSTHVDLPTPKSIEFDGTSSRSVRDRESRRGSGHTIDRAYDRRSSKDHRSHAVEQFPTAKNEKWKIAETKRREEEARAYLTGWSRVQSPEEIFTPTSNAPVTKQPPKDPKPSQVSAAPDLYRPKYDVEPSRSSQSRRTEESPLFDKPGSSIPGILPSTPIKHAQESAASDVSVDRMLEQLKQKVRDSQKRKHLDISSKDVQTPATVSEAEAEAPKSAAVKTKVEELTIKTCWFWFNEGSCSRDSQHCKYLHWVSGAGVADPPDNIARYIDAEGRRRSSGYSMEGHVPQKRAPENFGVTASLHSRGDDIDWSGLFSGVPASDEEDGGIEQEPDTGNESAEEGEVREIKRVKT